MQAILHQHILRFLRRIHPLLSGNYGRPGTGAYPLRGHNNVQGASDFGAMPTYLPGYPPIKDKEVIKKWEEAWHTELPTKPGIDNVSCIEAKMREEQIKKTKTVCTYCGVGCSFTMWTKGRKILKVQPEVESPANGISTCMWALLQNHLLPGRCCDLLMDTHRCQAFLISC